MCGLVGVVSSSSSKADIDYLKIALLMDSMRGVHSTGVAFLHKKKVLVHKNTLPGGSFILTDEYEKLMTDLYSETKAVGVIGHNRHATMGEIDAASAHPFKHGNITGAHNGTLTTHRGLTDKVFEIDSEAIFYALSKTKDPCEVLEQLNGAYALTWFDRYTKRIYFARNHDRPLHIAMKESTNTLVWASEESMLNYMIGRTYNKHDATLTKMGDAEMLPPGVLVSYSLKDKDILGSREEKKFNILRTLAVLPRRQPYQYDYYNTGGYGLAEVKRRWNTKRKNIEVYGTARSMAESYTPPQGEDFPETVTGTGLYFIYNAGTHTSMGYGIFQTSYLGKSLVQCHMSDIDFEPGCKYIITLPYKDSPLVRAISKGKQRWLVTCRVVNRKEDPVEKKQLVHPEKSLIVPVSKGGEGTQRVGKNTIVKGCIIQQAIQHGCSFCSADITYKDLKDCGLDFAGDHIFCDTCTSFGLGGAERC